MKKINANVFTSAVYSSFLGSVVVFVGMIVSFMTDGWALLGVALGGAVLFYFVTAIASCLLAVFVAGPIYVVLTKYGLANYYTSFLMGLVVTFVCFGFSISLEKLYWNFAGGVTGLLFHYHFINKPSWTDSQYLSK